VSVPEDLVGVLWRTFQVVHVTSGPVDRYGVSTDVESAEVDVAGYFEPTSSDESNAEDRGRTDEALLILSAVDGSALHARDLVRVDGVEWMVEGEPRTFDTLPGSPHHTEAKLVLVREGP
jgi:hypothetical protein